ncbi:hypothetical protein GCK32_012747 [Trichostrongylus colubriformis]|uniref:Fungal lipase-type domain-containing protein n=1 Tax=Trichostrongylus colubriformis TaxID=6319 RepID=A0AAN8FFB2_TRICO
MWLLLLALVFLGAANAQELQQCIQCIQQNQTWCSDTKTCAATTASCKNAITLSLNCPRLPDPAYVYSENFTRYYINPIVAGVFAESPVPCLKSQLPHVAFYKSVHVKCATEMPDVTCYGYTAWDPVEKAVIISFLGTSTGFQMTDEIMSFFMHKVAFFDDGYLFKYFHDAFFFLWNGGLEQQVRTLKYQYPDYKVILIMSFDNKAETLSRYNNNMAVGQPYTICQEADGDYCSNTIVSAEFWEHMWYFDRNIGEWGVQGCP